MSVTDQIPYGLNAHLFQTMSNGSVVSTPCYLDITQNPMVATNLSPVDDSAFGATQTDSYITIDSDTAQTQYRSYKVIGQDEPIKEA